MDGGNSIAEMRAAHAANQRYYRISNYTVSSELPVGYKTKSIVFPGSVRRGG